MAPAKKCCDGCRTCSLVSIYRPVLLLQRKYADSSRLGELSDRPRVEVCASRGSAAMKATAFLEQAQLEAQLVDAPLVERYGIVIHGSMTLLGDDEPPSSWRVNFKPELQHIDVALQMAGIDT